MKEARAGDMGAWGRRTRAVSRKMGSRPRTRTSRSTPSARSSAMNFSGKKPAPVPAIDA